MKKSHDNTIAAQLLGHIDPHSAGVTPSLQMSTTFVRDAKMHWCAQIIHMVGIKMMACVWPKM